MRLERPLAEPRGATVSARGPTFTQRPIRLYEQVRLRLGGRAPRLERALRFGFTAHEPVAHECPGHPQECACPDLVTRPGYWAKALPGEPERCATTVLAYWADRHGASSTASNEPVLFHCGVAVGPALGAHRRLRHHGRGAAPR